MMSDPFCDRAGYEVETLPFTDYTRWLFDASISESRKLFSWLLHSSKATVRDPAYVYACPVTTAYVEPAGISCAKTDDRFISAMLDYAVQI